MAYTNYNSEACSNTAVAPENMGSILACLNEFAKSAHQRARDVEARLLGSPSMIGKDAQDQSKLRPVQSVSEVIAETRALVGQTLDALDRIQSQL